MTQPPAPVEPPPQEENIPVRGGDTGRTCRQGQTGHLVGRPATSELGAEVMRLTGAGTLRWLRPGDIVTMEFREDRVNVHLDAQGRVARIVCG